MSVWNVFVVVLAVIGLGGLVYFSLVGLALHRFIRNLYDAFRGGPPR